jgi:hypothetical protein
MTYSSTVFALAVFLYPVILLIRESGGRPASAAVD